MSETNTVSRRSSHLGACLLTALLVMACGSSEDGSKDKGKKGKESSKPVTTITPKAPAGPPLAGGAELINTLRKEFGANHRAAMSKYANRKITLKAKVSMVIADDSFRVNDTGTVDAPGKGPIDVLCRGAGAKALEVKDDIEITGTLKGTLSGLPNVNLEVDPCSFKKL